ncbi:hypothetical protein BGZ95_007324, partial [Linnemannia exigua]
MSEQPHAERQYDLDGDPLDELDQGMEDVAISSNCESDISPPGTSEALSLDDYHEYRRKTLPDSASNHADTFLGVKFSARNEFDALLAASEEDMVTSALLPVDEDALIVLERLTLLLKVKILKATHIALLPAPAITAVPHDSALPSQAAIMRYSKHTSADTLLDFLSRTASAFNFIAPKAKKKRKRKNKSAIPAPITASTNNRDVPDMDVEMEVCEEDSSISYAADKAKKPKRKRKNKSADPTPVAASTNNHAIPSMDVKMKRLVVPIEIEGKRLKALIDPGATASFIHTNAATELKLNIIQPA